MRQINRQDAEKLIMTTMGDFRRREVRKWRFGTHFTDFHRFDEWDNSSDAERIRSEYRRAQEVARLNDVQRGRSPRHARGASSRRGNSRPPVASWTNRPRGRSSFPPAREAPSSSTGTRPYFDLSFAESTDNQSNFRRRSDGCRSRKRARSSLRSSMSTPRSRRNRRSLPRHKKR